MTKALLNIRLLAPADWQVLRDTRLRALIDSPHAFTSPYHRERRWSEHQWRQRFRAATWVVALEHGAVIGIAGLVNDHPEEPEHIESIWVAPTHRRRGVSRSLLDTVTDVARRAGLVELLLWVLEDDLLACHIYTHLGFEWTGERKPIWPGHDRYERRLRLAI
jgi:ribosomal protein S18 acetylase RimI-like enzyme